MVDEVPELPAAPIDPSWSRGVTKGARELNKWAAPLRADRSGKKIRKVIAELAPSAAAAVRSRARRARAGVLLHPTHPLYRDAAVELIAELGHK